MLSGDTGRGDQNEGLPWGASGHVPALPCCWASPGRGQDGGALSWWEGKGTGGGGEIIPPCSSGGSPLLSMALGTHFSFLFLSRSLYPLCRLVHLAIIHCVPAVALCCIAQLPREVLEIQNDLFQVCGCDRQKMEGRQVPQAAPWIDAQSICPFPSTPHPLSPEHGEGPM